MPSRVNQPDPNTSDEVTDPAPSYPSVLAEAVGLALHAEFSPAIAPDLQIVLTLARFFEFVLTIDYAPHASHPCVAGVGLSDFDVRFIFEIGENLARLRVKFENYRIKHYSPVDEKRRDWHNLDQSQDFVETSFKYREGQATFLDMIVIPAQALDIPMDYVFTTIWRFITSVGTYGTYIGSLRDVLARRGVEGLARRFWVDRHVVIPRLTINKRRLLMEGLETTQAAYFVALKGPSLDLNAAWGQAGVARSDLMFEEMVLTDYGKLFEKERRAAFEHVEKRHAREEDASDAGVWDAREALLIAQRIHDGGGPVPPSLKAELNSDNPPIPKRKRRECIMLPWKLLRSYIGSRFHLRYHFIRQ